MLREHLHDPRCRNCLRATIIVTPEAQMKRVIEDAAVMARVYPKDDPRNELPTGLPRRVLMCWRCANDRNATFEDDRPLEELWARSRSAGSLYSVSPDAKTEGRS